MAFHRTPINYLLVNLAIADALYATFVTPQTFLKLTSTHPGGTIGTVLCKLVTGGCLAWMAGTCSVVTLIAIAAERHYTVIYPAGNVGRLTKRKLKVRHFLCILIGYSNSAYAGICEKGLKMLSLTEEETFAVYEAVGLFLLIKKKSFITISIYQTSG